MKKTVLILVGLSECVFAQRVKKLEPVYEVPLDMRADLPADQNQLLNGVLKGTKWQFDLKEYQNDMITLDKDKTKPDVMYFTDTRHVQITLSQKDCKSVIKGTYEIRKPYPEDMAGTRGHTPFKITSAYQKCAEKIAGFLTSELDVSLDEKRQILELKKSEYSSIKVPAY